jgi:hypothetical protein
MAKGRDISAENLSDVLELIRKQRESGMLSVEHYQGSILEEGELYFQDGQIIYAKTGLLSGQEAFYALLRWRKVLFTFQRNARPPRSPSAATDTTNSKVSVTTNPPVQEKTGNTGNLPVTPPTIPQLTIRKTPSMIRNVDTPGDGVPNTLNATPSSMAAPGMEWIIPSRLNTDRNVLSLPLTRPQRSMYLLVDGQRSISDLARCTRKSFQEVEHLLQELQQRGLVAL